LCPSARRFLLGGRRSLCGELGGDGGFFGLLAPPFRCGYRLLSPLGVGSGRPLGQLGSAPSFRLPRAFAGAGAGAGGEHFEHVVAGTGLGGQAAFLEAIPGLAAL
jgi:hypothetical protein